MATASADHDEPLVVLRRPREGLLKLGVPHLRDLPRAELNAWAAQELGGPRFRGDQVFEWLHRHRIDAFAAMTNVSRAARATLSARARIDPLAVDAVHIASDQTRKLRLRTLDGHAIECVLIPNPGRGYTLCVSSMVGCSLTCRFCATASLGFTRNLRAWEIVDQVYRAQCHLTHADVSAEIPPRISNLVLMGMGEPLHNFEQVKRALLILTDAKGAGVAGRRITVSTSGLVPGIERFAREGLAAEVGLAISLNATTDVVRDEIMPINRRWNIARLLAAIEAFPAPKRRRVTFEYVLLAGINDSDTDARRLVELAARSGTQVNVIPFNPHPHAPYRRPAPERVEAFVTRLRRSRIPVYVRTPRGDDIAAACGQLALESAPESTAESTLEAGTAAGLARR